MALDFLSLHYYPRQGKLDDDMVLLKHYAIGKPLVIEEIFPLSADPDTTAEFIRRSRTEANGWISFFWGRTPDQYYQERDVRASFTGNWLRRFCALRREMPGSNPAGPYPASGPPTVPTR